MSVTNEGGYSLRKTNQELEVKKAQPQESKISEAKKLGRDIRKGLDKIREFGSGVVNKEQSVVETDNLEQIKNFAGQLKEQLELIHSDYYIISKKAGAFIAASVIAAAGAFGYTQILKAGSHPGEIISIDGESAIYDKSGNIHLIKMVKPEIKAEAKSEVVAEESTKKE